MPVWLIVLNEFLLQTVWQVSPWGSVNVIHYREKTTRVTYRCTCNVINQCLHVVLTLPMSILCKEGLIFSEGVGGSPPTPVHVCVWIYKQATNIGRMQAENTCNGFFQG